MPKKLTSGPASNEAPGAKASTIPSSQGVKDPFRLHIVLHKECAVLPCRSLVMFLCHLVMLSFWPRAISQGRMKMDDLNWAGDGA